VQKDPSFMGVSAKVDIALKIYDAVKNLLIVADVPKDTADKYAHLAVEMYEYIEARPQLQFALEGAKSTYEMGKGAQEYVTAAALVVRAENVRSIALAEKFAAKGTVSAGGAISAFVDYSAGMATNLGIEMNMCAIAVTKVMLNVLTIVAMADTVVLFWAAALQALSLGSDVNEMKKACMQGG
jgi:hypothetical protein